MYEEIALMAKIMRELNRLANELLIELIDKYGKAEKIVRDPMKPLHPPLHRTEGEKDNGVIKA